MFVSKRSSRALELLRLNKTMAIPDFNYDAPEIDHNSLLLIVVGVHLRAEVADRPLAYRLRDRILQWQLEFRQHLAVQIEPVVCSDVWYLNNEKLQSLPTISIGGPGVNALSAYFAQNLREKIDPQQVLLQIDPEFTDLRTCIWGTNHELTVKGLDLFESRYLDGFLRAVATQVEPQTE